MDDQYELRMMLRTFLAKEGYQTILMAADCAQAEEMIRTEEPDLVILDVNLPDGDGFSLMKRIRAVPTLARLPVLFLSARGKDTDRLTGLGLGADDYMVKPFLPKELMLRMAAILKRCYVYGKPSQKEAFGETGIGTDTERGAGTECGVGTDSAFGIGAETKEAAAGEWADVSGARHRILDLGTHIVDFDAGTVRSDHKTENLTVKELQILEALARERGKIVTFDRICQAVWNAQYDTYENTVMVHMRRLRAKVEDDPSHPKWIVTARGLGYKLNNKENAE